MQSFSKKIHVKKFIFIHLIQKIYDPERLEFV